MFCCGVAGGRADCIKKIRRESIGADDYVWIIRLFDL